MSLRIHTLAVMVRCVMLHTGNKSRLCQERKARRLASIKNNLELIPRAAKREEGNFCKKGKRQNGFLCWYPVIKNQVDSRQFFLFLDLLNVSVYLSVSLFVNFVGYHVLHWLKDHVCGLFVWFMDCGSVARNALVVSICLWNNTIILLVRHCFLLTDYQFPVQLKK